MAKRLIQLLVLALLGISTSATFAGDEAIFRRMNQLEEETTALRAQVAELRSSVHGTPVSYGQAALPAPEAATIIEQIRPEIAAEAKAAAWTKGDFKIVPYGYLWGSMIYQTARTTPGAYTVYVPSADDQGEDAFILDARRTRLGLDLAGPAIPFFCCATSGGKVEIDFQSPVTSDFENRATVQLRHAYWEVKDDSFQFLAGQTWDIISPLYPSTLNYSVGWDGGNIGYRRAQVRLARYFYPSDQVKFSAAIGLAADVVSDLSTVTGVRREPSDWPVLEGRVAVILGHRGKGCRNVELGLSGHIGEQGFDFFDTIPPELNPDNLPAQDDVRIQTWSMNVDLLVPISDRMTFKGEYFNGTNLGTFLGGIGQGVCPCLRKPIRANGGWMELGYDLTPRWHTYWGFGIDDPNVETDALLGRRYNQFIFANTSVDLTKKLNVGVEVAFWKTLYHETRVGLTTPAPGESTVIEFVARYGF